MSLLIVGSGDVADAVCAIATTLGWESSVTDSLPEIAERISQADAVVVLSHDPAIDGPALAAGLAIGVGYLGAMGSRRTQARRREWLTTNGVPAGRIDAVNGPAGLDIGAVTPAEIAVSIVAEVIAIQRGADGASSISERPGPIHPGAGDGPADCPAET
jgi:xanthine/CO dehydrogenase XdhC/CoxF family maturation factor